MDQETTSDLVERLRQSEAFACKLLDSSLNGMYIYDVGSGSNIYINAQYTKLTGYTLGDLNSMAAEEFADLFHPEDREAVFAHMGEVLEAADGQIVEITYRFKTADGRWIWCLSGDSVFERDREGKVEQFMGTFLDVSEIKQAQRALHEKDEQLRQSQKMEAIGRLAGGVAHDFNNILAVIMGHADILLSSIADADPLVRNVHEISEAATRAASLTEQLLAFSRRKVLQPTVINFNVVLDNMGAMLRRLIGEHIEVRTSLASDLWNLRADRTHLEQVIMNLVVNARDAMLDGGKLTLETANVTLDEQYARTHADATAGPHVMLSISDTGHGMDKATLERAFDPFFTTKDEERGTGLGLATVYGIVRQSGGNIWVYSELGRGTTFKIYFPQVGERVSQPRGERSSTTHVLGTMRRTETILVVEDEPSLRNLLEELLAPEGYRLLLAASGEEALSLAARHDGPIDLLLTDVVMPGMSGRALGEALRKLRSDVRVLYMSGYTDNAIGHHGIVDAGVPLVQKPFQSSSLLARVRDTLDT